MIRDSANIRLTELRLQDYERNPRTFQAIYRFLQDISFLITTSHAHCVPVQAVNFILQLVFLLWY